MSLVVLGIVRGLGNFYASLIVVYVLMSWFPMRGIMDDVHRVIGSLVEPYLAPFRRVIPVFGGMDISPIVALVVLQFAVGLLVVFLQSMPLGA